ncbi:carboxypeptidase-like regulatory domain-containing protein [Hymenobacter sp. 15J16-1T3B]|uniref:carboxypeptidase-like regulatory domain-containing protein n=1 Tax=Hymenobacter sp. 15J16-1T3B TaxID=2886941 RepID=UPI001D10C34C|nr:carboxypeptidase-like regulatory domain-containing protein [Hymenobacter sp. 15J16-1T3B]MCC3156231.1 carboxypeptidase-like regulatory domain-containing protein [Hymenobacter sp. 15J16-1T3B]
MRITAPLLLLLTGLGSGRAWAQVAERRPLPSGRVVGSAQQPLAGVSVLARGTTLGTSTNAAGFFLLPELPRGPLVLRFELGGYLTTDVPLTDTTRTLTVRLLSTRPPARGRRN